MRPLAALVLALAATAPARAKVVVHQSFDSADELQPEPGPNRARGSAEAKLTGHGLFGDALGLDADSHARIEKLSAEKWRGLTVLLWVNSSRCEQVAPLLRSPRFTLQLEKGSWA